MIEVELTHPGAQRNLLYLHPSVWHTVARPLFGFAVRQNEFGNTLGRFALDIGKCGHPHAALLNFLNDCILVRH